LEHRRLIIYDKAFYISAGFHCPVRATHVKCAATFIIASSVTPNRVSVCEEVCDGFGNQRYRARL
jgi:hypothetical protein